MLDQVPRYLGRGRDDRVEEASLACCLEQAPNHASGRRVTALDGGGGQEYLAYQRGSWRQVPQRPGVQVPRGGLVIVGGERDPGQQQASTGGGQSARELDGDALVAKRQAQ